MSLIKNQIKLTIIGDKKKFSKKTAEDLLMLYLKKKLHLKIKSYK